MAAKAAAGAPADDSVCDAKRSVDSINAIATPVSALADHDPVSYTHADWKAWEPASGASFAAKPASKTLAPAGAPGAAGSSAAAAVGGGVRPAPRLQLECAGWPQLCQQTNAKPVVQTLLPAGVGEAPWHGQEETDSACFVFRLKEPACLTRVSMRTHRSPFVSVHAATPKQAAEFDTLVAANGGSAGVPVGVWVTNERLNRPGKLVDDLLCLIPKTQVYLPAQASKPEKRDRILQKQVPHFFAQQPVSLVIVRCWPFYDRPRAPAPCPPTAVGLYWAAVYGLSTVAQQISTPSIL